jgi:hypothetical protein
VKIKEKRFMTGLIIGLSGRRGVGKSLVANHLVEQHGFLRIHPFQGGKAACVGYFVHVGATPDEASRMVNGDLKDLACPLLPDNQTPRFFMEKFGQFMGVQVGPEWTIGQEVRLALERDPNVRLIAESIVYEVDVIRNMGGVIVEVVREGSTITGLETDKATALITPDIRFQNNGNSLTKLCKEVDLLLGEVIEQFQTDPEPEPC